MSADKQSAPVGEMLGRMSWEMSADTMTHQMSCLLTQQMSCLQTHWLRLGGTRPEMVFGRFLQHMAPFGIPSTGFCMVFQGATLIFSAPGARFWAQGQILVPGPGPGPKIGPGPQIWNPNWALGPLGPWAQGPIWAHWAPVGPKGPLGPLGLGPMGPLGPWALGPWAPDQPGLS